MPIGQLPQTNVGALPNPFGQFAPPQLTQSQALPSTVGPSNIGGADIGALMQQVSSQLGVDPVTQKDITAALTPVTQKGPTGVPSYYGFRTPNPPPAMIDTSERIGKSAARSQGIGNAISATVGALAQFKATRDQRKQEADATKVSRLVEAQNAITQAQQIQPGQPGYEAAQKAIQDNNNIIQGMFQDPKFVKTIEKGFQISMTDPSQNKTQEHGIVQRGLDMFRQRSGQQVDAQEAMKRFQANIPTQIAPNQQAIQALQTKMAQQKAATEYAKAFMPMMVQQTKFQQAQTLQNAKEAWESVQNANKIGVAYAIAAAKNRTATGIANARINAEYGLEARREASRLDFLTKAIAAKAGDPIQQQKLVETADKEWQDSKDKARQRIDTLNGQLNNLMGNSRAGFTTEQKKQLDQQIKETKDQIEGQKQLFGSLDANHDRHMKAINKIIQGGGANAGSTTPGSGGTISGGISSTAGEDTGDVHPADAAIQNEIATSGTESQPFDTGSSDYTQWLLQ